MRKTKQEGQRAIKGIVGSGLSVVFLVCLALKSAVFAEQSTENIPEYYEAWEEAVSQAYPQSFIDSLVRARQVNFTQGLRSFSAGPFLQGERLFYDAGWGPLNAGYGVLEVATDKQAGRVEMKAVGFTNKFFSAFYKVRDYLCCSVDLTGMYPFFFEEHLREGRYKDDRWYLFDHEACTVYTHKKKYEKIPIPRFSQSVMTLMYVLRSRRWQPGDTATIQTFVQKKNYAVFFACRKRDRCRTKAGEFNCVVLEPRLVGKGRVFTKKDRIRIWLSDDERSLPVLMKSKIAVGSISVELIGYEHVR